MHRMFISVFSAFLAVGVLHAHFPFIVPEWDGPAAKLVFSDDLNVDTAVGLEKLAGTQLTLRDGKGKESLIELKKADGFFSVNLPGSGERVVYGTCDYGVLQKGESKPFKLVYFPKAVLGGAGPKLATVGDKVSLEVLPLSAFGKIKFQVLSVGKPVPDSEVTVILPNGSKKAAKTDKEGFTPEYEDKGRYGVVAKLIESKTGDFAGKKYEEVRNYATLVCSVEK
jgi:uncharacterized GH25 family protein